MTASVDRVSPLFVGEDRITASLSSNTLTPLANGLVTVEFDYSRADQGGGVVLPLVVTVQPPGVNGVGYVRRVFYRSAPTSFTFRVKDAGRYFIQIRESGHNKWQGRLLFTVAGEEFSQILDNERL